MLLRTDDAKSEQGVEQRSPKGARVNMQDDHNHFCESPTALLVLEQRTRRDLSACQEVGWMAGYREDKGRSMHDDGVKGVRRSVTGLRDTIGERRIVDGPSLWILRKVFMVAMGQWEQDLERSRHPAVRLSGSRGGMQPAAA